MENKLVLGVFKMNSVYAITNKLLSCQKELYELELNGLKKHSFRTISYTSNEKIT